MKRLSVEVSRLRIHRLGPSKAAARSDSVASRMDRAHGARGLIVRRPQIREDTPSIHTPFRSARGGDTPYVWRKSILGQVIGDGS